MPKSKKDSSKKNAESKETDEFNEEDVTLDEGEIEDATSDIEGNGSSESPILIEEYKKKLLGLDGVGPAIADKLIAAGKISLESIATASVKELAAESGIGENTCLKLIQSAMTKLNISWKSASQILKERKEMKRFTTGSKNLDDLLNGGVEPKAIFEWYGEFRTGKTQICHQCCVTVQLPLEHGGLNGSALYIDAEGTFRPERLIQITETRYKDILDPSKILDKVFVARVYSADHQKLVVQKIPEFIMEHPDLKLIVVDSIMTHFRAEYIGRGMLSDRQQQLNKHVHLLFKHAETYNLSVFFTNQVSANPASFIATVTPVGGHVIAHASTYRIFLKKGKAEKRIAKLVDSPSLPEREEVFAITESGIDDVKK